MEDALEQLAGQRSLMEGGISETMQNADQASQLEDRSYPVIAPDERTPQNDAVVEGRLLQAASSKGPAAEDQIMEHGLEIDIHNIQETAQEGLEPTIEDICQQIGYDKFDTEVPISTEVQNVEMTTTACKSAEVDNALELGDCTQEEKLSEGMDIQEDDLLKTVSEAFEARHLVESRPIPVLVKGKAVDLVQLSFQVRACGGYDQVTLWSSISKSLGFGQECGPLLKLVYVKYLKSVENRRLIANQAVKGSQNVLKRENEDSGKSESVMSQSKSCGIASARKKGMEDGSTIDNSTIDHGVPLFAEGTESLAAVLEWVKRLALNPGDPKKGQGARVSRLSEAWAGKCETLASRVREVLRKQHEHPLFDLSPSENQDPELERKKRAKAQVKGSSKKARCSSG